MKKRKHEDTCKSCVEIKNISEPVGCPKTGAIAEIGNSSAGRFILLNFSATLRFGAASLATSSHLATSANIYWAYQNLSVIKMA